MRAVEPVEAPPPLRCTDLPRLQATAVEVLPPVRGNDQIGHATIKPPQVPMLHLGVDKAPTLLKACQSTSPRHQGGIHGHHSLSLRNIMHPAAHHPTSEHGTTEPPERTPGPGQPCRAPGRQVSIPLLEHHANLRPVRCEEQVGGGTAAYSVRQCSNVSRVVKHPARRHERRAWPPLKDLPPRP